MANLAVMYSSSTDQWATPQDFFDELNKEFSFDLDPWADAQNHKCERYFTKEQDGLRMDWGGAAGYSAIRHMEERSGSGCGNAMRKDTRRALLW